MDTRWGIIDFLSLPWSIKRYGLKGFFKFTGVFLSP